MIDAELPTELKPIIDKLLEMKQNMPEMGLAPKSQADIRNSLRYLLITE